MSLGYQSQVHGTFVRQAGLARRQAALAGVRAQPLVLPAVAPGLPAGVRGRRARAHPGSSAARRDWALPYWNYTDFAADPQRLALPLPLQGDTLPAGVTVPGVERAPRTARSPTRCSTRRARGPIRRARHAAGRPRRRPCCARTTPTSRTPGRVSFGGGVLEDPNNPALFHDSSNEIGQLDVQPHGSMHVEVSGAMARFETAALDPVFWMHHCNVDRLWETYARDLGHGYPFENGVGRRHGGGAVLDRPAVPLPPHRRHHVGVEVARPARPRRPRLRLRHHRAAATPAAARHRPARLRGRPVRPRRRRARAGGRGGPGDAARGPGVRPAPAARTPTATSASTRSRRARSGCCASTASAPRVPPRTSYEVFLGLAPAAAADPADAEHHVGLLSLFGVYEASRDDGTSAADGQRRQLDVTAQVAAQAATFRPLAARVRLRATNPGRDLAGVGLSIGRVTLEFA